MARQFLVIGLVIACFLNPQTGIGLPPSAEDIYKTYAKQDPKKGITRQEFAHYLRDSTLSPSVKALYESGTAAVVQAVDADVAQETAAAFIRQGVAPGESMSPYSFKDYITAFPPRKTILPQPLPVPSQPKAGIPSPKPTPSGFLDRLTNSKLHDESLHVTRTAPVPAVPGGADPGPAQLNWTHAVGSPDVFTIDAAISYTYDFKSLGDKELLGYYPTFAIVPSFEAHTSNSVTATQDSLKAKLDLQFALDSKGKSDTDLFQLQALSIAPAYERDRVKKTETYGGEVFYTPVLKAIPGMTALYPLAFWRNQNAVVANPTEAAAIAYPGFVWSPSVGFEVGHATINETPVYGTDPDYARFVAKLKLDLYLFPQFDLSVSYAGRVFLNGEERAFSFFEIAPTWYIFTPAEDVQNPKKVHFAIGLDFKDGETTPSFKHVDSLSAFVGMKF